VDESRGDEVTKEDETVMDSEQGSSTFFLRLDKLAESWLT
jgi:hypothetical protein